VSKPKAPDPSRTDPAIIRNFCIIAHIDHGKSTLADRMLQITGVVDERLMRAQYLDRMDIERERGITIKSQAVRLPWVADDGRTYVLNMIDTPGHVDFTYEVSRSLAACEGTVLLVDAAQGIEAQTLANLYLALENDLQIIPVLNKIDLPAAQPDKYAAELAHIIGCDADDVLRVSAKTGDGVGELLNQIVRDVPAPVGDPDAPARAIIFDSIYDSYRGVVTYVRVIDGQLSRRERIAMLSTKAHHELLEIGVISPEPKASDGLGVGEVGYLMTGVKDVRQSKVGDTVTSARRPATEMLGGYKDPSRWCSRGSIPSTATTIPSCATRSTSSSSTTPRSPTSPRRALRWASASAAASSACSTSRSSGSGSTRVQPRPHLDGAERHLPRRHGGRHEHTVTNPSEFPTGKIDEVHEPYVRATILSPSEYIGAIMELCQSRRGNLGGMDYLSEDRWSCATRCRSPRSSSTSSTR
jgi:GTP-binding protein LepA